MTDALTTIQVVSNALYILLALVAIRLWLRHRTARGAIWVAATFVSAGLVVALSLALGPDPVDTPLVATKVTILLLLVLPASLHRFVVALEGGPTTLVRAAEVGVIGLAGVTLVLPSFPGPDDVLSPFFVAYTFVFLGLWGLLNIRAAVVLLRAAKGQPAVVRRRLQVLASGAIGLALALIVPAAADNQELAVAGAVFGVLSGLLFLVGFAPPGFVRAWWRQPEELALHEATRALMLASKRDDVAELLLPRMGRLIGARGSALLSADGVVVSRDGDVPADIGHLAEDDPEVLTVPVAGRQRVVLWLSPWSPLLGDDERRLLDRLTVLADLALDRAGLFEGEQRARADAEQAHREVEGFVATITHDLRNPLTTIGGMADLMLGPLNEDISERAEDFIERIRANATYMGALVDDILALAEVGQKAGRVEVVDLRPIADAVSLEIGLRAPLATIAVHDLPVVLGDQVRLRRLFENIVGNALKHGGREDIRVDITSVRPEAGWVELRFLDNGQGVPPESAEKVFGVFERIEGRSGKGTGLGLAICRKLVEQWGGSMWFATSAAGADLRIRVPEHLVVDRPVDESARAEPAPPQAGTMPEPLVGGIERAANLPSPPTRSAGSGS